MEAIGMEFEPSQQLQTGQSLLARSSNGSRPKIAVAFEMANAFTPSVSNTSTGGSWTRKLLTRNVVFT